MQRIVFKYKHLSASDPVYSSIERTEAFGVVLLEAMSAGKSSIIFNIKGSGTSWVVKDRITGFNVPLDNEAQLINAINTIAVNPDLCKIMGNNARERFKTKFHIDQVGNSAIKLYEKINKNNYIKNQF